MLCIDTIDVAGSSEWITRQNDSRRTKTNDFNVCLLYTSDAADE